MRRLADGDEKVALAIDWVLANEYNLGHDATEVLPMCLIKLKGGLVLKVQLGPFVYKVMLAYGLPCDSSKVKPFMRDWAEWMVQNMQSWIAANNMVIEGSSYMRKLGLGKIRGVKLDKIE